MDAIVTYATKIAARIKEAMASYAERQGIKKLRFSDFAELCEQKLSPTRLSNYANAIRMPGPGEATIMARALGIDAAWLMCLKSDLSNTETTLIRNLRALPENERNAYIRRIEVLALAYREPVPDENHPLPKQRKRVNP